MSNVEIASRLNVHARTVGRALEGVEAAGEQWGLGATSAALRD